MYGVGAPMESVRCLGDCHPSNLPHLSWCDGGRVCCRVKGAFHYLSPSHPYAPPLRPLLWQALGVGLFSVPLYDPTLAPPQGAKE